MVLTVVEAAKFAANNGEDKKAGVLMTFAQSSQLLSRIPIVNIQGNSYAWTRTAALSTAAFRAVNGSYTADDGKVETYQEPLKLIGGDLDVDKFLVQTNGGEVRTVNEMMKSAALAQKIGAKLITGDTASDAKEFDGLAKRYGGGVNPSSLSLGSQVISNGGAGLSMKTLDQGIDAVDENIGQKVLIMSQATRRNITAYLRTSGTAIQMTVDQFGNQVMTYAGLPIIIADGNGDTAGIAFNEPSSTTSVYVVALGPTGVHMIQSGGIDVRDLGEINTAPVLRTRVEWYCGLVDEHPRCVCRIGGIGNATAVA